MADQITIEYVDVDLLMPFEGNPRKIEPAEMDKLRSEFLKMSEILARPEHFVLNHRDYHSRNVLIVKSIPFIIDTKVGNSLE